MARAQDFDRLRATGKRLAEIGAFKLQILLAPQAKNITFDRISMYIHGQYY